MLAKEGVFIYKKLIISVLFIFMFFTPHVVHAKTHPEFQELIFPYCTEAMLIEDMSKDKINEAYKKVKRKMFGWNVGKIVYDQNIKYVGDTVFAKANNTSNALSFVHTFEVQDTVETSVSTSGDITLETGIKGKKITAAVDAKVRREIGKKTKYSTIESVKTSILIPAKTKLSVIIKGDARLNNGVGRYYFLGIGVKKGTWEYIDVVNEYYDYYEEKI